MKRRKYTRIALAMSLAMLLSSPLFALADAPELIEIEIEGLDAAVDNGQEALTLDGEALLTDGDALILDGFSDEELLLDGPLALDLPEDALAGEIEGNGLLLEGDAVDNAAGESLEGVTEAGGMDNEALLEAWMKRALPGKGLARNRSARSGRASLDGLNLRLYDALAPMIREVAEGKRTSTQLEIADADAGLTESWWTADELGLESLSDSGVGVALLDREGFAQRSILRALLTDYPYELYWFDKATGGMGWSFSRRLKTVDGVQYARLTRLTAKMSVAADYSKTGEQATYEVNDLPARVSAAVSTINDIVADNRDGDDLSRLRAYANVICAMTAYNSDAAGNPNTPYGDPWQLIFLFDGDADTKVVCEGYTKGFKCLCDLSEFNGDVTCEMMSGAISTGNHMWNAVHMSDGRCYLVDLTNSDGGDACNGKYFLKGCQDQTGSAFTCNGRSYAYDEKTLSLFTDAWLFYAGSDYGLGYGVSASATYGALSADPEVADAGATVTLTLIPETGYAVEDAPDVRCLNQPVDLHQVGNGQWQFTMPYGDVSASATCAITYTAQGWEGVYDGQPHGIQVTSKADAVAYGTASGTYDLAQSPTWADVGTYTVYYRIGSGDDALTGEANVVIAPRTAELSWSDTACTYDGSAHAPVATVANLVPGDACGVTVTGGQVNASSYTATATGLSNGNYALSGNVTQVYTIAPKTVSLSWSNTAFTYDGNAHAPVATVSGLIPGDACGVTVTGGQVNAGSYTAMATGLSNGNYALSGGTTRAYTIAPKTVGLSWSDTAFTYDGSAHAPVATVTGLVSGDACVVTVTGGQVNAGSYTAMAAGLSNGNYALSGETTRAYTIAPRAVGLSWSDTAFTYDGSAHVPVATVTGLVPGDACAVTVTGEQVNAGSYTATAAGLSNGNYALSGNVTQAYTIAPRAIGLSWSDTAFTYDGNAHVPVATVMGLVPGDVCAVTVVGGQVNAGSYTATAAGLSNGNYALSGETTRAYTIAPRVVGLKWRRTAMVYNGQKQKPTATATGLVPGDVCAVTVTGARKNAGVFKAKASRLSNGNYALPDGRTKTYRILKKTLRLKWSGTRLKYTGKYQKPTVKVSGLIPGDRCRITTVGAKKKRGVYTVTATKLSNRNYQLPANASVRFRIY